MHTQIYIELEFLIETEIESDRKVHSVTSVDHSYGSLSFLTRNKNSSLKIPTAHFRNILEKFKDL